MLNTNTNTITTASLVAEACDFIQSQDGGATILAIVSDWKNRHGDDVRGDVNAAVENVVLAPNITPTVGAALQDLMAEYEWVELEQEDAEFVHEHDNIPWLQGIPYGDRELALSGAPCWMSVLITEDRVAQAV